MDKLLKIYNSTFCEPIGTTPAIMQNDRKLEREYIIKKLYERERRGKIKDSDLPEGQNVRYILEREPLKKHRYKVSPEYYKVSGRDGLSFIIMAKDGTTKTISRWRLFPVQDIGKLKFGATFGNNRGELQAINGYSKKTKKYKVSFIMPDGSITTDQVPAINLRGSNPQIMGDLEREFLRTHPH
jgi:hypothetical protein